MPVPFPLDQMINKMKIFNHDDDATKTDPLFSVGDENPSESIYLL